MLTDPDEPQGSALAAAMPRTTTPLRGCFVTGTDTEVGKTAISTGLLHLLGRQGVRVAGYKPVAAGAVWRVSVGAAAARSMGSGDSAGYWHNDDVEALLAASTIDLTRTEVCPCLLEEACAPHLAAELEGGCIDPQALIDGAHRLMPRCDALVVEGVGGFCVPLVVGHGVDGGFGAGHTAPLGGGAFDAEDWGADDLAAALDLPVILVVGMRLGCINHALLTAQSVADRGLRVAGWVANRIDAQMPHAQDNIATIARALQRRHAAPLLGVVGFTSPPTADRVADQLDTPAVLRALALGMGGYR
jgi:dethiobiotin synthetase